MDQMDYEKYAKDFWENGFILIEHFFDKHLMDTLNAIILEHYGLI